MKLTGLRHTQGIRRNSGNFDLYFKLQGSFNIINSQETFLLDLE